MIKGIHNKYLNIKIYSLGRNAKLSEHPNTHTQLNSPIFKQAYFFLKSMIISLKLNCELMIF